MKKLAAAVLLLFCVGASTNMFADILVGAPPTGGDACSPFGCYSNTGIYQQAYVHTAFSGITTITGLDLFRCILPGPCIVSGPGLANGDNSTLPGTWSIYLSTSTAAVGSLNPIYTNNIGLDETLVYTGSATFSGLVLHFADSNPFTYNPANGDLLLTLVVTGSGPQSDFGTLFTFNTFLNPIIMEHLNPSGGGGVNGGLATNFETTVVTPEPSSFMLLGSGMLGLAGYVRRRVGK